MLVEHLQLSKGTVIVPHSRRANQRTLPLHPLQMLLLIRVSLTQLAPQTHLYQSLGATRNFERTIQQLHAELKKHSGYKNLFHIRHSVVMNWLKRHNLRQVQYNAGHRYISTTERYLESDYEELKTVILERHPLG